jgi:hypothetical protein
MKQDSLQMLELDSILLGQHMLLLLLDKEGVPGLSAWLPNSILMHGAVSSISLCVFYVILQQIELLLSSLFSVFKVLKLSMLNLVINLLYNLSLLPRNQPNALPCDAISHNSYKIL